MKKIEKVYSTRRKNERIRTRLLASHAFIEVLRSKDAFLSFLVDYCRQEPPDSVICFLFSVDSYKESSKSIMFFSLLASGRLKEEDLELFFSLRDSFGINSSGNPSKNLEKFNVSSSIGMKIIKEVIPPGSNESIEDYHFHCNVGILPCFISQYHSPI